MIQMISRQKVLSSESGAKGDAGKQSVSSYDVVQSDKSYVVPNYQALTQIFLIFTIPHLLQITLEEACVQDTIHNKL